MLNITDSSFDATVASSKVLIDFKAEWCAPCKKLAPALQTAESKFSDVTFGKVDIDTCPEAASKLNVEAVPTLVAFKNGKEVARNVGFVREQDLERWIKTYLLD